MCLCVVYMLYCISLVLFNKIVQWTVFFKYVVLIYAICPLFIMLFSCVGACSLFSLVSWFTDCCYVVVFLCVLVFC